MILEIQERGIGVEFCNSTSAASLYNMLLAERNGEGVALFIKGFYSIYYIIFHNRRYNLKQFFVKNIESNIRACID